MLQIFLAVAVLVYSVVIGTSKYDLRSDALNKCGTDIKQLIRRLRNEIFLKENNNPLDLNNYHTEYDRILTKSENHARVDYLYAVLESKPYFKITGFKRAYGYFKVYLLLFLPYIIPTLMMLFEILFILDILGITACFTHIFGNVRSL